MTRPRQDTHDLIVQECRVLQSEKAPKNGDLSAFPNATALIESAISALEASVPQTFEHEGRTYWLNVLPCWLDIVVFDDPASAKPLLQMLTEGLRRCGYRPAH